MASSLLRQIYATTSLYSLIYRTHSVLYKIVFHTIFFSRTFFLMFTHIAISCFIEVFPQLHVRYGFLTRALNILCLIKGSFLNSNINFIIKNKKELRISIYNQAKLF